ncbi:Predicted transcriptional regulator [Verrucomicrobium sp. GAS474]|uniref:BlaI/MecI/CopY family transcriptional regulator n=1 Tax=Verrucomicrobium sp. GAS474 TaxID=1882831 RepID=UPI00087A3034|nr:BlaI/MecI/CopY family transcriptional regulator [Verrucomicrobium sp. GAS474]SDT87084.1 Predicted transcriptional regulator [Verrucomicrobium sp. GAS474]
MKKEPGKALAEPTDSELQILQELWNRGEATVKEVHEALTAQGKTTGYTTVLKLLQIMTEKGLVVRDEARHAHLYRAVRSEDRTQRQLLSGILDKAFRGSMANLVMQALATKRATAGELKEIERLIKRLSS